jgi:hypothetical protein
MNVPDELLATVESESKRLALIGEQEASQRPAPGKWSAKEILGHLIDSASNNHQRFVRAQEGESLTFPKYEQDHWVRVQDYNATSWPELIELWRLYNRHLAHVIERIPTEALQIPCHILPNEKVTLGFLVEDYVVHMRHHLGRIGATAAA